MIKSMISNYISKYITNISPSNMSYNIFSKTLELYDVSLNPLFIPNIRSNIAHLKYTFSLSKETVIIRDLFLEIEEIPSLVETNGKNMDIQIFKATLVYLDFEFKILEVVDNVIRGLEVFYKKSRIISATKLLRNLNGFYIKKLCVDINELQLFFNGSNTTEGNFIESLPKKYKINIDKANANTTHGCFKEITILENKHWICKIRKTKFMGEKFSDIIINLQEKLTASNDDFFIEFYQNYLKAIVKRDLFKGNSTEIDKFPIKNVSNALQSFPEMEVDILYRENHITFNIKKGIFNLKINGLLEIQKIELNEDIIIENVIIKDTPKNIDNELQDLTFINLIPKYIDCNIFIANINIEGIFINKLAYLSQDTAHIMTVIETNCKNYIDLIEIKYLEDKFILEIYNLNIADYKSLLKYYQPGESAFNLAVNIYNIRVTHNEIKFFSKSLNYKKSGLSCIFDIKVGNNYFIEDCALSYKNKYFSIEKLFINMSDNLVHEIKESEILSSIVNSNTHNQSKSTINLSIQSLFLTLFNTANKELVVLILTDIVLSYSNQSFSLNIRKGQIDNQEYLTKYPIIFKSMGENFLNLNIANNEVFLDIGKFKLIYDDLILKMSFLTKYLESSSDEIRTFNFTSFVINNVECTVFYKYLVDLKLDYMEIKSFNGTLMNLKDRLHKFYVNMVSKKIFGLILKNIRNNLYTKSEYLGYKNDIKLPVPWYTGVYTEYRIKYPMPMRHFLGKYDLGLCMAFYIFNKMDDKFKSEVFKDGCYVNVSYKNKSRESFLGDNILILTNKRLLMSSKINIKDICIDEISVNERNNYFLIGDIKIIVERKDFIKSLCEYLM